MKTVFVSYSSKDTELTNLIDNELLETGFEVIRDVRALQTGDNIEKFMQSISSADYVFAIISDNYLKSRNCMYEMCTLKEDPNYAKRLYSIVDNEADIYKTYKIIDYIRFWSDKADELESLLIALPADSIFALKKEVEILRMISNKIGAFLMSLAYTKNMPFKTAVEETIKTINRIGITNDLKIEIVPCHYAYLKYMDEQFSGKSFAKTVGINSLKDDEKVGEFQLPMLQATITNTSGDYIKIKSPTIKIPFMLHGEAYDELGFFSNRSWNGELAEYDKAFCNMIGVPMISIIESILAGNEFSIHVEDHNGKKHFVDNDTLKKIKKYFTMHESDIEGLRKRNAQFSD